MKFRDLPRGEKASVQFFQKFGLPPLSRQCPNRHAMKLCFGSRIFWNMRKDNWFQDTKMSFANIACFFYRWAYELTLIRWCERELDKSHGAAVDYNSHMRQICHEVLWMTYRIIGFSSIDCGTGLTVEVDESAYTHRKYQKGRFFPTTWVFGGICRETRDVFIEAIEKKDSATLEEVISRRIHPESIIITDLWKGYSGLARNKLALSHLTVNHKKNFVDPESGAHTNTVERMWRSLKKRNKSHSGTARHHLEAYLEEFW